MSLVSVFISDSQGPSNVLISTDEVTTKISTERTDLLAIGLLIDWDTLKSYVTGDRVLDLGLIWEATANSDDTEASPPNNLADWKQILGGSLSQDLDVNGFDIVGSTDVNIIPGSPGVTNITGLKFTDNPNANSKRITSLAEPIAAQDAATKNYVDSIGAGDNTFANAVLDKDLSADPGGPATGDRYIVASGGSGLWAGKDDDIAEFNGTTWDFTTPTNGFAVMVRDEDLMYEFGLLSPAVWSIYRDPFLREDLDVNDFKFITVSNKHINFVPNGTGKVQMGNDSTNTPEALLHLFQGSAVGPAPGGATMLMIEDDTDVAITFMGPNTSTQTIFFGDADANSKGAIKYDHTNDCLVLRANGEDSFTIDSTGRIEIEFKGLGASVNTPPALGNLDALTVFSLDNNDIAIGIFSDNTKSSFLRFGDEDSNNRAFIRYDNLTEIMTINVDGTDALEIDDNGRIKSLRNEHFLNNATGDKRGYTVTNSAVAIDESEFTNDVEMRWYGKDGKWVIAFKTGNDVFYLSIPIDGSTTALTASTSAP